MRFWCALGVLCLFLAGCAGEEAPPAIPTPTPVTLPPVAEEAQSRKLVILGMDSLTWAVLQPMMRQGKLPAWKRVIAEGTAAPLETLRPTESLLIWTTMVTGKPPEEHGLTSWTGEDGQLALTSNLRRTEALWTILPRYGRSAAFLNWWGSWPAEETKGLNISRRHYLPEETLRHWPPTLGAWADPPTALFRKELQGEALARVGIAPEEVAGLNERLRGEVIALSNWLAFDERNLALAEDILARHAPDLTGIFLRGLDPTGHQFWRFFEPGGFSVPPEMQALLSGVLPRYYAFYEEALERILAAMDEETSLLIVSDHGMYTALRENPQLMGGGPSRFVRQGRPQNPRLTVNSGLHNEAPPGVLLAWGPMFRAGRLGSASVHDIAPTVLAALGLAVPRDMPGRVLEGAFRPEMLPPIRGIATYETGQRGEATPIASDQDAQIKEDLRGLGYIGG